MGLRAFLFSGNLYSRTNKYLHRRQLLRRELIHTLMTQVFDEVEKAISSGNAPFAAIVTDASYRIVARAHNRANTHTCAIEHAEILAIREACQNTGQKYLHGHKIFVNAQSCAMCSVAIIKSGIEEVYFGCPPETSSNPNLYLCAVNEVADPKLRITGGLMSDTFLDQVKRGRGA
ncbi:MAG: hypothetical protein C0514_08455 [Candidatus Puniceispirillum sp.]|nr:hypothetical protein [Candidatus Puniceispirillum sp.]